MHTRSILFFAISMLLFGSCGSQRKIVNKYYLLEIPEKYDSVSPHTQAPLDGYCEISPVEVYPAFSAPKIAIKSNSREIQYYSYHYWAQRPGESFTFILEDYFTHTPIFKGVATRYWRLDPSYKLLTTIYHLEIIEEENEVFAHLELEFRLTDSSQKEMLVTHRVDRRKAMETTDLNLFAQLIGELFFEELTKFSDKVIQSGINPKE